MAERSNPWPDHSVTQCGAARVCISATSGSAPGKFLAFLKFSRCKESISKGTIPVYKLIQYYLWYLLSGQNATISILNRDSPICRLLANMGYKRLVRILTNVLMKAEKLCIVTKLTSSKISLVHLIYIGAYKYNLELK